MHYLGYGKMSPKNIRGISRLIKTEHIDIVHLQGYSAANFGRLAARKRGIPNIIHEHAVLKVQPHQYVADKLLSRMTDTAIAVSGNVKDFMVNKRSISAGIIQVIGNGIDLGRDKDHTKSISQEKRKELGIGKNIQVGGTVTRLREEKGNEYLIKAVPTILEGVPNFVLLVIGDGPLKERLQQMVKELDVGDAIKFLGFRSDVPELLSMLDVQIIPSLTEGFPLSLAEAMATGNAIVATEVGGMKEIGKDNDTVLFVPPKDPDSLAEKTIAVLQNEELKIKLSDSAKAASTEFSIQRSAAQLARVYEGLLMPS